MQPKPTASNRDKLAQAKRLIREVSTDEAISPTPYAALMEAVERIEFAARFALSLTERDTAKFESVPS